MTAAESLDQVQVPSRRQRKSGDNSGERDIDRRLWLNHNDRQAALGSKLVEQHGGRCPAFGGRYLGFGGMECRKCIVTLQVSPQLCLVGKASDAFRTWAYGRH